jgi:hypothetical protein
MMSDTPETDKQEHDWCWQDAVPVDFARKLERERNEAMRLLRRAYNGAMDHDIDSRELDEKIERVLRGEEER